MWLITISFVKIWYMITITSRVEAHIKQWPLLKQGMDLGLINLSALARQLRPELETEIGERISDAAVMMALRRYQSDKSSPAGRQTNPKVSSET
jgi:hypothetical protein